MVGGGEAIFLLSTSRRAQDNTKPDKIIQVRRTPVKGPEVVVFLFAKFFLITEFKLKMILYRE